MGLVQGGRLGLISLIDSGMFRVNANHQSFILLPYFFSLDRNRCAAVTALRTFGLV
jgi:hypothetical protein